MASKLSLVLVAVLILILVSTGAAFAISGTFKNIAGLGGLTFTNEIFIENIAVSGADSLDVYMAPTENTRADSPYLITVYLDSAPAAVSAVEWTQDEITDIAVKLDTSTGLDLAGAVRVSVEVLGP